ncbi:sugar phosphate isomerase/epimerase family protein [Aestuariivirga sp.]|jgi:sugar phosphate isomerase/epimerase|uniref:sugar phosphate isomerase/epimerase family protein n=1 Tax=Aestuariivirga sp. TaxID=2650926 RepID=UPI003783106C
MIGHVNSFAMPFSNVAHLDLAGKLLATRVAGYKDLSQMPIEIERMAAAGISPGEVRRRAAGQGITIGRLDPLNTWPRIWLPDNMDDAYIATVDTPADRFFPLAESVGARYMSLNATFPLGSMSIDEVTEHYARICKRADDHGLICDLEPIPLWGVPTLEMAWRIVKTSGARNGGLVIDTWHMVRGGSDISLLNDIPGHMIHSVQLNDGPLQLPPGVTIKDNCYDRKFPGDGEFPNVELVQILARTNGLNQLCPEVFSPRLAEMSAEEVGIRTRDSIQGVLQLARIDWHQA